MPSVWDYLTASPAGVAAPEQERRTITGSVADFFGVEPIRLEGQHRRISEQAERRDTEARQLFLDDLSTTIPEHAAPAFLLPARERQRLTDMVREGYRETFGGDPGDEELGNFNRQFAVRSNTRHLQQMARAHERDLGDASEWVIDHASALALAGGPVTRIAGLPAIGLQAVKDWVKQRDLTGAVERFQRGEPTEQDMTQLARTIAANDRAYGAGIGQRLFDAIVTQPPTPASGVPSQGAVRATSRARHGSVPWPAALPPRQPCARQGPSPAWPHPSCPCPKTATWRPAPEPAGATALAP